MRWRARPWPCGAGCVRRNDRGVLPMSQHRDEMKSGLEIDLTKHGLGVRSKRYAMLVDNGVVKVLNVEDAPPAHGISSAETICSLIDRSF